MHRAEKEAFPLGPTKEQGFHADIILLLLWVWETLVVRFLVLW